MIAATAPTTMPMMAPRPRPPDPPPPEGGAEFPDAEALDVCGEDGGEGVAAAGGWAGAGGGGLPGDGDGAAGLLEGELPPRRDTPFTLRPAGVLDL